MERPDRAGQAHCERAFTLSEVTMSVGIVAAVLLPILGLLATGSRLAVTSQDQSAATAIVTAVSGGLRDDGGPTMGPVLSLGKKDREIDASGSTPLFAAFSAPGDFLRYIEPGEYESGLAGDTDALYLAAITLEPMAPTQGGILRRYPLLRLTVKVESPAFAAAGARSTTRFHTRTGAP